MPQLTVERCQPLFCHSQCRYVANNRQYSGDLPLDVVFRHETDVIDPLQATAVSEHIFMLQGLTILRRLDHRRVKQLALKGAG